MHPVDRLLAKLADAGHRRTVYEAGSWHDGDELATAIGTWRRQLVEALPRRGAVLGLQSRLSFDSIACVLAAWAERAIVAFLPPGTDPGVAAKQARADVLLQLAEGGPRWTTLERAGPPDPLLDRLRAEGDAGLVIFTSGSTGRPKAAVHGLSRFLKKFDKGGRAMRTLAVLQLDHVAGLDALLATLCSGGAVVIAAAHTPHAVCKAVEAAQVEVLSASPSFLRLLAASDASREFDASSVRIVTYGSEPMDVATLSRVAALFPGARLSQKYGTTELGAPRTASEASDSLWIRLDGVQTDVRGGVLWVRSDSQFLGYLDETAPVDADGWYCTGDRVDHRDGWFRIHGREGDLISVGGEKVSPAEVEAVILELDDVRAVMVHGEANALLGQVVAARVELRSGAGAADAERRIRAHCRERLPRYQVPVRVDIVSGGLVSDRQKVLRRSG